MLDSSDLSKRSHTPKGQAARERILRSAEPLFAARGFHGASMRDVAEAAEVPLATVVYHFARKETLYGAVLADINAEVMNAMRAQSAQPTEEVREGEEALHAAMRGLIKWALKRPARLRLLLREIIDNPLRVSKAATLPLAPVLTTLSDLVSASDSHSHPEIAVLHVVGAISYVIAARPTLKRIIGADREKRMMAQYERVANDFVARTFRR